MKPDALVLQAHGSNRDLDVMEALRVAGANPVGVPLNELRERKSFGRDFQLIVVPGGFSYADALGAGKLLAIDLAAYFADEMAAFVGSGKPVIGICNGFQALVRAGILPGRDGIAGEGATLTFNSAGRFECRWVDLKPVSERCIWTNGLSELITCPIAHGEGNFQTASPLLVEKLQSDDQVALAYVRADGSPARGDYPANPNGSAHDIAGVCNPAGNVLGLMPHPENHIFGYQHPRHTRGEHGRSGLALFVNGVQHAKAL